jgi:hypothetical protein
MRSFGFTIVLNGLHHLQHQDQTDRLLKVFDRWAVAEGASSNTGSTYWCKPALPAYHDNGRSTDGTLEYLWELVAKNPKLLLAHSPEGCWPSKDEQVRAAVAELRKELDPGETVFLWEIDADEVWEEWDMRAAEQTLLKSGCKEGRFTCDYFLGPRHKARGMWGEGRRNEYRRLWIWSGEEVISHEPPAFAGLRTFANLPQRFRHYAYYFEQDVLFKSLWYGGHEGVYDGWKIMLGHEDGDYPLGLLFPGNAMSTATRNSWIQIGDE